MKLDAHQHFWRYNTADYAWIGEDMESLRRDFLPADLWVEQGKAGFNASIAVQARQSLEETLWLLSLAKADDRIEGVVGWADLRSRNLESTLSTLEGGKLLGLRHVIQDEDASFMQNTDFLHGLALLEERGLSYDILIHAGQLEAATEMVSRFPKLRFVLDHLAKPKIKDGLLEPWAAQLTELSRRPNVACKISGFATEADWKSWKYADFGPYFETALNAFGSERLIFGSDWPVCTLAADYSDVAGLARQFVEKLSATEQAAIFGGNARRIYGSKHESRSFS